MNKFVKFRNRSHYLKWPLDEVNDISIRYYFTFESKKFKKYENNYVLKSHVNKTYTVITEEEAEKYIKEQSKSEVPRELFSFSGENYEYLRFEADEDCRPTLLTMEEEYE